MVVHRQLARNRPVVLADLVLKAEVRLPPNRLDKFLSLARNSTNPCLELNKPDSDNSHSSRSLDSFRDSPVPQVVPHLARSVKEVTDRTQGHNLARSRFPLAVVAMVDQDPRLVRNHSLLVIPIMVAKVAQHRLLGRNLSVVDRIMVRTEL